MYSNSEVSRLAINSIQIPMLGPLQLPPKQQGQGSQQQQNQQQTGQQQLQQQLHQNQELLPPPQSGQDFTLSSVLHFLQTEWRRYERDRNEWEIERAEMRVRLLQQHTKLTLTIARPVLRCSRVNDVLLRMSNSTSCAVSKCSNMHCVSNGKHTQPSRVICYQYPYSSKQLTQPAAPAPKQVQEKEGSGGSSPRSEGLLLSVLFCACAHRAQTRHYPKNAASQTELPHQVGLRLGQEHLIGIYQMGQLLPILWANHHQVAIQRVARAVVIILNSTCIMHLAEMI